MNISYSMARPILYVVRHGATGTDESYNSPVDDSLNEQGRKQAAVAGDFLKGRGISAIFSSGFKRGKETAAIVSHILGIKPEIDDRLDSLDVGNVKNMDDEAEADRVITHHVDNPHEVIPGGESIQHFRDRTHPALRDGVKYHRMFGSPAALVAHHSVEHEVGNLFNGKSTSALTEPGGVVAVFATDQGLRAVPIFKKDGHKD